MDSTKQLTAQSSYGGMQEPVFQGADCESKSNSLSADKTLQDQENGCEVVSTGECKATQRTPEESASLSKPPVVHNEVSPGACKTAQPLTTRENLHASAHQIITEINSKRKQDSQILSDFKAALDLQVAKNCSVVEQNIFDTYEREGKVIQSKLQELYATLDNIAQLETELLEFKQALQFLYQEMQQGD